MASNNLNFNLMPVRGRGRHDEPLDPNVPHLELMQGMVDNQQHGGSIRKMRNMVRKLKVNDSRSRWSQQGRRRSQQGQNRPHHGQLRPHHGQRRPHHGQHRPHHGQRRPHHGEHRPHHDQHRWVWHDQHWWLWDDQHWWLWYDQHWWIWDEQHGWLVHGQHGWQWYGQQRSLHFPQRSLRFQQPSPPYNQRSQHHNQRSRHYQHRANEVSNYWCRLCKHVTVYIKNSVEHQRHGNASLEYSYYCDICSKPFPSKYRIMDHLENTHMYKELLEKRVGDDRNFQCGVCLSIFNSSSLLASHLKTCSTGGKLGTEKTCQKCGKCFKICSSVVNGSNAQRNLRRS